MQCRLYGECKANKHDQKIKNYCPQQARRVLELLQSNAVPEERAWDFIRKAYTYLYGKVHVGVLKHAQFKILVQKRKMADVSEHPKLKAVNSTCLKSEDGKHKRFWA